jgi:predicted alpha/beta-hydrolase family hydrolase
MVPVCEWWVGLGFRPARFRAVRWRATRRLTRREGPAGETRRNTQAGRQAGRQAMSTIDLGSIDRYLDE